jgi:hypothetical protein
MYPSPSCRHTDPCLLPPLACAHRLRKAAGQSATVMLVCDAGSYVVGGRLTRPLFSILTLVHLSLFLHTPKFRNAVGPSVTIDKQLCVHKAAGQLNNVRLCHACMHPQVPQCSGSVYHSGAGARCGRFFTLLAAGLFTLGPLSLFLHTPPGFATQWVSLLHAVGSSVRTRLQANPCSVCPLACTHRFRKAAGQSATVLLVRDAGGYVFGAFCIEAWKPNSRFFGTGETFVFQLAPHKVNCGLVWVCLKSIL